MEIQGGVLKGISIKNVRIGMEIVYKGFIFKFYDY
jgi:hypothetical protein